MRGSAEPKPPESEITVAEMCREALAAGGNEKGKATDWLVARILGDRALFQSLLPRIVRAFCEHSIGIELKGVRQGQARASSPHVTLAAVDGSVFRDAVEANAQRLMDRPLWGGKPIGDATSDEIYASADSHDKLARTHTRAAAWEAAVAAAVEKNGGSQARTRDCLTEGTLQKLWEEADV